MRALRVPRPYDDLQLLQRSLLLTCTACRDSAVQSAASTSFAARQSSCSLLQSRRGALPPTLWQADLGYCRLKAVTKQWPREKAVKQKKDSRVGSNPSITRRRTSCVHMPTTVMMITQSHRIDDWTRQAPVAYRHDANMQPRIQARISMPYFTQ